MADPQYEDMRAQLARARDGDARAHDELYRLLRSELAAQADRFFRERPGAGVLAAAGLVEAACRDAVRARDARWGGRAHFLTTAAAAMRAVLVERAPHGEPAGVAELDRALRRLAESDPELAGAAEIRYFGGLTSDEAARWLGRPRADVEREWSAADARLRAALTAD